MERVGAKVDVHPLATFHMVVKTRFCETSPFSTRFHPSTINPFKPFKIF
jgi:hypothetical protein